MVRISNYVGNVCWSHRVGCVRSEEREEGQRIEQCIELQNHQFQKRSCQTMFLVCSTYAKGSSYQIIKKKGDCDDSKQAIEA